ncbi:MAG: RNA 2',3'-cyclic phosphodiesterase [Actinomycetota bacterium]
MPPRGMRLFVAVTVPAAAVAEATAAAAPWLSLPGTRRVRDGSQHVTVRFLGSVPEADLPEIARAIGEAARASRSGVVRLRGLGAFPGRRARVLWAGVDDDGVLAALAVGLSGFPGPDGDRPYRPHLTLARYEPPARLEGLPGPPGRAFGEPFPVRAVVLFRSHPGPEGSRHEALGEFPLGR